MTPKLYFTLLDWLDSGTDTQRAHAEYRLSLPDAVDYVPESHPTTLRAIPPIVNMDPWLLKIRACPHFSPGCCHSPAPYCDKFNVNPSREMCIECLGGTPDQ